MTVVSYAQNYEDIMLLRALGDIEHGFYVDVGAQDPVEDSVTKLFYERGWRGINIEPVASWYEKLVADRPGDVNLRIALGASEGEITLYEFPDTGLSTTDAAFAQRHLREGRQMVESVVRTTSLDTICEEQGFHTIHFLKIDVEGAERAVLEGFSFAVRPWVVVVEATLPNTQIPAYSDWEHLLTGRGYRLVYQDGLNRFYLDDAHSELAQAFATPPNVFDRFVRFGEWRARVELHQAREAHERLAATQNLLEARERAAAAEAERNAMVAMANERAAAAEAERNAMIAMANELRDSVAAWSEVAKAREATLALLQDRVADLEGETADLGEQLHSALDTRYKGWLEIERLRRIAECVPALEAERIALTAHLSQRESDMAGLRHELQRMLDSHSWRITRPLRGARRQAGKVKAALRRRAVVLLRGTLTLAASWAPARALGRRLLADRPQLAERLLRLSGRLPALRPADQPGNLPSSSSVEPVLTPRAREILRAMLVVESPASPGSES